MFVAPEQRWIGLKIRVILWKFRVRVCLEQRGWKSPRLLLVAGLVVSLLVLIGLAWYGRANAYAVLVNGERVAIVAQSRVAEQALQSLLAEKSVSVPKEVQYREEIKLKPVRAGDGELDAEEDMKGILASKLSFFVQGAGLAINGDTKLWVADEESAHQIVERLKEMYRPRGEGITIDSLEFEENVTFTSQEIDPAQVKGIEEAVGFLVNETVKTETHTVRPGESLWSIAESNNLSVKDLMDANPRITSDVLRIGQVLNLVKPEPLVHVVASYRQTVSEYEPYPVRVNYDDNLWRGQERVLQRGREGEKEVLYRVVERNGIRLVKEVLEEKVLAQPVEKVVSRGTKMMLASRDGGGSGTLGWPIRGSITSPFGPRGGEFHTGLDLDGVMGEPVVAAEEGLVTFTGSRGTYGKQVVIDHGDGMVTTYSHLSGYRVSEGQRVSRGDIIGLVGSTGRSTGSHLHFEVIVEGNFRNPLDYLGR